MSIKERTTYHPKWYRVIVQTPAGPVSLDADTLEEARSLQATNTREYWPAPRIRACWHVRGQSWIDSEEVR